jgi:hypothetical protein
MDVGDSASLPETDLEPLVWTGNGLICHLWHLNVLFHGAGLDSTRHALSVESLY